MRGSHDDMMLYSVTTLTVGTFREKHYLHYYYMLASPLQ